MQLLRLFPIYYDISQTFVKRNPFSSNIGPVSIGRNTIIGNFKMSEYNFVICLPVQYMNGIYNVIEIVWYIIYTCLNSVLTQNEDYS